MSIVFSIDSLGQKINLKILAMLLSFNNLLHTMMPCEEHEPIINWMKDIVTHNYKIRMLSYEKVINPQNIPRPSKECDLCLHKYPETNFHSIDFEKMYLGSYNYLL